MTDENSSIHPSLYLAAMLEYDRKHDYQQIEKIRERALEKIDSNLKIRSEAALKAAYASSCLMNNDIFRYRKKKKKISQAFFFSGRNEALF